MDEHEVIDAPEVEEFESATTWTLPNWLDRLCRALVFLVSTIGTVGSLLACLVAARSLDLDTEILVGGIAWLVLFYLAAAVHELGHYLAAKAAGMHPFAANCGPLQLIPHVRGFRWRLKRTKSKILGSVAAFPDPRKPIARQIIWLSAGGPLASLVVGSVSLLAGLSVGEGPWDGFAYAFAIANLCMGIGTLVPTASHSGSDGLGLLRAFRLSESDPGLLLIRLNGLAVTGTTADRLPVDQVELLRGMPDPVPMLHFWFVLKGMQNQARWSEAAGLAETLESHLSRLDKPTLDALADFTAILRCELRFSAMLARQPHEGSFDQDLTAELDWLNPSLRPRCLAAEAAFAGDTRTVDLLLSRAELHASRSVDAAQRISEKRMREAIKSMAADRD